MIEFFKREQLALLVKQAQGNRTLNNFAKECDVSSSTLSRIINNKNIEPPHPSTLQKIAANSHITYFKLMDASGYITKELIKQIKGIS